MKVTKPVLETVISRKPTIQEQAAFDTLWKMRPKPLDRSKLASKGVDKRAIEQLVKDGAVHETNGLFTIPLKLTEPPPVEETPDEAKAADAAEEKRASAFGPAAAEATTRLASAPPDQVVTGEDQDALGISRVENETVKDALARHAALIAPPAKDAKPAKAEKEPKAPKVVREKVQGPCLCGCGAMVTRPTNFVPGHDAKFKSVLKQQADRNEAIAQRDALIEKGEKDAAAKVKVKDAPDLIPVVGQKEYVLAAAWATPAMKALFADKAPAEPAAEPAANPS